MAGRLLALLREGPRLIVSLPANSAELAQAAADGGAEALKVHLNVTHAASGATFGSLTEERDRIEAILAVGLPTGIVPGVAGSLPSPAEMAEMAAMGLDFFDLYAHDMPAWMARFAGMTRTLAIAEDTPPHLIGEVAPLGVEMIEAAIIPHDGYGEPLCAADLLRYRAVRRATDLPIIVPTQRAIAPDDVPALLDIEIDAVMIGAIVTGREAGSLHSAAKCFRAALDGAQDLGMR